MRILLLASFAVALATLPLDAAGAPEAFPGRNGLIVFASDRTAPRSPEIYAAALAGGAPRNLTRNEGWESRPLTSPDGLRIAFLASTTDGRRGLFVMDADGGGRRFVAPVDNASWAPDSRRLVADDQRGRIAVVEVETGAVRPLVEGRLASWSPDGRHIAFFRGAHLHVVADDGSDLRRLAPGIVAAGVLAFPVAWSPDGTRLAFAAGEDDGNGIARRSDLYVVRVADGVATRVTDGRNSLSAPRWSPDGRELVFSETPPAGRTSALVIVNADGTDRRQLTPGGRFTYDENPSWSPDGRFVAFTRGSVPATATEVLAVRRDGSGVRRLSAPRSALPAYEAPTWSHDGRAVLFARASSDLDDDLLVTTPDGRARRLTDNTVPDRDPAWSPDGSQIAFVRTVFRSSPLGLLGNDELFVMRADGTGVRRLTRYRYEDLAPSWSPDGTRIAFARRVDRTSLSAIYTIRPDGTGLRRVTVGPPGFHSGPAWSPDGRSLALTAGNGIEDGGELYVAGADGSRPRRIARIADFVQGPQWSPDGRLIAVTGFTTCGGPCVTTAVYVVRRDGSGLRKVAEGGGALAWSPDGRSLAIAAGPISVLDLRSGRMREIVRGDATHTSPDWQPRCTRAGTRRADRLRGSARADLLCGFSGDDRITGGGGSDRLFGGLGDDRLHSRDGRVDVVGCGAGRDSVVADARDLVGDDCEAVSAART